MKIMITILLLAMGYLYGSVPFALVVGKVFYHTDIRTQGSGNLGGTNAGRVLGKKAGAAVILLDATKCIITILIARSVAGCFNINADVIYPCAFACIVGHCYPIFAHFKGGKAVSSSIAYALMTNIYGFVIGVVVFLVTLKASKFVSLSSMLGSLAILIASPFIGYSMVGIITNLCIVLLIWFKHIPNIKRMKEGTESKITWMK